MREPRGKRPKAEQLETPERKSAQATTDRIAAKYASSDILLAVWLAEDAGLGFGIDIVKGQEMLKRIASGLADPEFIEVSLWQCSSRDEAHALRLAFASALWLQ